MQPIDIDRLQRLVAESGATSPVSIVSFGPSCKGCQIMNGTLGPAAPVEMQTTIFVHVLPSLRESG
jgi:hypothetical protein